MTSDIPRRDLWKGRFSEPPAAILKTFGDSFPFDWKLLAEDIQGSIAWARALERAGVLAQDEARRLVGALLTLGKETQRRPPGDHEDVHSFVEAALSQEVSELSGKLHTGRSRNDQVATDLKLYLKTAIAEAQESTLALATALVDKAEVEAATAMPGYTHLRRAVPVTLGHWCLAYVEMLLRDADRFSCALKRGDTCPLGSGALAGTPLPIDREAVARDLGFSTATANSLDAVSDRDMGADYLSAASLLLVHLSRLAEDVIFFSSDELSYLGLPDALTTGSSRMPHKKNPDALELIRGHAGRALGELTGFLAMLKGLPLAYNKDLQLDKEPLFRTRETLSGALALVRAVVVSLIPNRERMKKAASDERLLTTELADAIARRGVPFREAHEIVGRRVAQAEAQGTTLSALGPGDGVLQADLLALDVDRALARRDVLGGTAPARVRQAAAAARARIARLSEPTAPQDSSMSVQP